MGLTFECKVLPCPIQGWNFLLAILGLHLAGFRLKAYLLSHLFMYDKSHSHGAVLKESEGGQAVLRPLFAMGLKGTQLARLWYKTLPPSSTSLRHIVWTRWRLD